MAPVKFEENIREKLQEREIQPSAEAWKKLESQLGEPKPSMRASYRWWAIAASLIAILLIGGFLYNGITTEVSDSFTQEDSPSTETPDNNTQLAADNIDAEQEDTFRPEQNSEALDPENAIAISEERSDDRKLEPKSQPKITKLQVQSEESLAIATVDEGQNVELPEAGSEKSDTDEEDLFLDGKVDQVVAEVLALKKQNTEVSPEEINALLDKAQREISSQRLLEQSELKIDAASLLEDAELEIERSFRDKVFDVLGEGFQKVRTAVAERNN